MARGVWDSCGKMTDPGAFTDRIQPNCVLNRTVHRAAFFGRRSAGRWISIMTTTDL